MSLCLMNLYNVFHFLKWVTKNIDLFYDIQIVWDVPVLIRDICEK